MRTAALGVELALFLGLEHRSQLGKDVLVELLELIAGPLEGGGDPLEHGRALVDASYLVLDVQAGNHRRSSLRSLAVTLLASASLSEVSRP